MPLGRPARLCHNQGANFARRTNHAFPLGESGDPVVLVDFHGAVARPPGGEWWEGDNQAPAFTIDLVDEAQRGPPETRWTLTAEKTPKDIVNCRTSVHFNPREDVFELRVLHTASAREISERSWFTRITFALPTSANRMRLSLIEGSHTVSRDGHLLKTRFQARLRQEIPFLFEIRLPWEKTCFLEGEVVAGQFFATLKETTPSGETSRTLDPVTLPRQGAIFNPLHPVNRITGRRLDQRLDGPSSRSGPKHARSLVPSRVQQRTEDAERSRAAAS